MHKNQQKKNHLNEDFKNFHLTPYVFSCFLEVDFVDFPLFCLESIGFVRVSVERKVRLLITFNVIFIVV